MAYWLEGAPLRPEARLSPRLRSASFRPLENARRRLRLALAVAVGFAFLLSFVLFPARRLVIQADGAEVVLVSREQDVASMLGLAGVHSQTGDIVIRSDREVRVERATPVLIDADGQLLSWRSRASKVQDLLDEIGLEAGPYDTLLVNGLEAAVTEPLRSAPTVPGAPALVSTASANEIRLSIHRAVPLTIIEDGRVINLASSRPTVAMTLRDAGIKLGPADEVYPAPTAPLIAGLEVQVRHAKAINLRTGATSRIIYTHQESLKSALAEAGLELGPEDRVEPGIEAAVANGMTARLVRVAGRLLTEKAPVLRRTVFKADEGLSGFNTRVVQGRDGQAVREYRIVIEDGVERQRTLTREYMEPEVIDNVIYYAASAIRATGYAPENLTVITTQRMWTTWYNAGSSGKAAVDPAYGFTYTGLPLTRGVVAVDPRVIPLGSRLYIPGYGFAIAADTGGGIVGDMLDLAYPDGAPVDWRTGWVDVYLLAP